MSSTSTERGRSVSWPLSGWTGALRGGKADDGFAAVDAIVALVILATTVTLSLIAGRTAVQLALAATETRSAEGELRYLLAAAPQSPGAVSGRNAGFDWQVATVPIKVSKRSNVRICEQIATARSLTTGRGYRFVTDKACPP